MFMYTIAGLVIRSDIELGPHFQNFTADGSISCTASSELRFRLYHQDDAFLSQIPEFTVDQEQFSVSKLDDGFLFRSNVPAPQADIMNPVAPAGVFINRDYSEAAVLQKQWKI